MRFSPRVSRRHPILPAGLFTLSTAAVAAALAPAAAVAAPFTCEASVLSGTIATAPAIEPLVLGRGGPCKTANVGLPNLSAPLGVVSVKALAGATSLTGDPKRQDLQQAVAGTGIADLKVGSLGSLGLPLPLDQVPLPPGLDTLTLDVTSPGNLTAVVGGVVGGLLPGVLPRTEARAQARTATTRLELPVVGTLPTLPPLPVPLPPLGTVTTVLDGALPGASNLTKPISVDIGAAVRALLKLPSTDLLKVRAATTLAGASCLDGEAVTAGSRTLAGVSVLGNEINLDTLKDQPIVDTQMIKLSDLDPNLVKIPAVTGVPVSTVTALVLNALKALPAVPVPVDLLRVLITPGSQEKTATDLTQNGPGVKITALGRKVVDLQLGQSKVGTMGVDCDPPEKADETDPPTAAAATLACTKKRLVLTDVVQKGSKVRLFGVADQRFAGDTVKIVFEADGKTAATAKVRSNGEFSSTAKLPSKKLRSSNKARYRAQIGKEKSRNLKLERRLLVDKVRSSNGRVRLTGHVTRPLGTPAQTITLTRRLTCKKSAVVKRFKPESNGKFSVLVKAPEGAKAQVYRFKTKVRKTRTNKKLFPTFTLPTGVDLT